MYKFITLSPYIKYILGSTHGTPSESAVALIGSLSNEDDDGTENATKQ